MDSKKSRNNGSAKKLEGTKPTGKMTSNILLKDEDSNNDLKAFWKNKAGESELC